MAVKPSALTQRTSPAGAYRVLITDPSDLSKSYTISLVNMDKGFSGGRTIIGGTASGENLTLNSTSHATKGKILFAGIAVIDEVNSRFGIGTTFPTRTGHFKHSTSDCTVLIESGGSEKLAQVHLRDAVQFWIIKHDTSHKFQVRDATEGVNALVLADGGRENALNIDAAGLVGFGKVPTTPLDVLLTNGSNYRIGYLTESITLNTGGTTTDSSANLLPADSIILAVVSRITTTITTASHYNLGDSTTVSRFLFQSTNITATNTDVGLLHQHGGISTDATGPVQISAAKLRITTNANPGAGVIRVGVVYQQFTAPTS